MARTLTAPGPLDTLEEAFDLLQSAPAAVWLRYLSGAAPLIVGLLFAWSEFSSSESARYNPLTASIFLVVLLVWFYRSRQVFARELLGILCSRGENASPGSWWAACFEGTKLLVMPLLFLSILPIASGTAFYRSLALFAAEGLSPRDALAKAWKTALAWQRENWFILGIIAILNAAVLINVAVAVLVSPILVRMFTGYENVSAERLSAAGTMFPIILMLTWLCLDPLLQAVYTVRAFHWEGLRTGEDLLVRLKRLAPLFLLLICFCAPLAAEVAPKTTELNRAIDQALHSPQYDWRIPPADSGAEKRDWFVDAVDRTMNAFHKVWKAISDLLSDLVDWLEKIIRGDELPPDRAANGKPSGVRPVFYLIGLAILALAGALLWKLRPRKAEPATATSTTAVDLTNEAVLASDLPEDEWLAMAERYAGAGDLRLALRALYLGTLALLNRRGLVTIHACKSNRDYEGELRRRSRDNGLTQTFRLNIRSFEQSWYGFHEVTGEQLQLFRDNLARMRS